MKPAAFEYERPASVADAVAALGAADEAKILAGGQSLIPMMNFRLAAPPVLVDISRIPGLDRIEVRDGRLRIGGLVTHQRVATSETVAAALPILSAAAALIGHLAIRNRGTVAGSLAHSDPAAEWPLLCRLLDARVSVHGPTGPRTVAGGDLNTGFFETCLGPQDLITGVEFDAGDQGAGWGFTEFARRHGDFALVMSAAVVELTDGAISDARIGLGAVGPTAVRATDAEQSLIGQAPSDAALDEAAGLAADACSPASDAHASADYRRRLVRVLTGRALRQAVGR